MPLTANHVDIDGMYVYFNSEKVMGSIIIQG